MRKSIGILGCLAVILLWTCVSFAGEKVLFYYTDPAGTPMAMTDSSGNVVWRADYKPFGEEQSITQTSENNKKLIGKEKKDVRITGRMKHSKPEMPEKQPFFL